jgi:hypothetical protein
LSSVHLVIAQPDLPGSSGGQRLRTAASLGHPSSNSDSVVGHEAREAPISVPKTALVNRWQDGGRHDGDPFRLGLGFLARGPAVAAFQASMS